MERRVVITGMGLLSPVGKSVEESWENIKAGVSGVGEITLFDTTGFKTKIAGEVKDFVVGDFMDRKEARKMARFSQFAVAASKEALEQSKILESGLSKDRIGTILGNGIGGMDIMQEAISSLVLKGPDAIAPMTIPKMISNEAPGNVAISFGITGPCYTVTTACSSGVDAIGQAMHSIRYGQLDAAITGGTEATISKFGIAGFNKIQALSTRNDEPKKASRPFDKDRDGFIMGEGAGILILEEYEHAKKRGARILGEIKGFAMSCDANHLTAPLEDGSGSAKAIKNALADAGLEPKDIDYINAHGTSTPTNDPVETRAIKLVFGDLAKKIPISSTKSVTAHLLGAAGAIETIICAKVLEDQFVPPTINLDNPDEECDLDYVPNVGRKAKVTNILSQSLGFGGHNGALVIGMYHE